MIKGIDLSHWNGDVDFKKARKAGVEFAMLKIGGEESGKGKFAIDKRFYEYYLAAKEAGIKVGAYMFAGKDCHEYDPEANVDFYMDYMYDRRVLLDYPFAIDIEAQNKKYKTAITSYVYKWCKAVESANHFAMIYGSRVLGFQELLDADGLSLFAFWVASYTSKAPTTLPWAMWQYSSTAHVDGLYGFVDVNNAKYDFAEVISRKGLNTFL